MDTYVRHKELGLIHTVWVLVDVFTPDWGEIVKENY